MKNNEQEVVTSVKFFFDLRVFLIETTNDIKEKTYYITHIFKKHQDVNKMLKNTSEEWLEIAHSKQCAKTDVFDIELK